MQEVNPLTAFEDFESTTTLDVSLKEPFRSLVQRYGTDWSQIEEALKQDKAELNAKIAELEKANARIAELEKQLAKQPVQLSGGGLVHAEPPQ